VFILLPGAMKFQHGIKTIGVGVILAHSTTKNRSIKVVLRILVGDIISADAWRIHCQIAFFGEKEIDRERVSKKKRLWGIVEGLTKKEGNAWLS